MSCPARSAIGPVLAPAGHAAVDQPRVPPARRLRTEAEAFHHAGPEAFDERVGGLGHAQHGLDCLGLLQVQRQRAAIAQRDVLARALGAVRALDPDHVGAEIGEQHGAKGTRADSGDFKYAEAGERTHGDTPFVPSNLCVMLHCVERRCIVGCDGLRPADYPKARGALTEQRSRAMSRSSAAASA
jgi:hypothetical protein